MDTDKFNFLLAEQGVRRPLLRARLSSDGHAAWTPTRHGHPAAAPPLRRPTLPPRFDAAARLKRRSERPASGLMTRGARAGSTADSRS